MEKYFYTKKELIRKTFSILKGTIYLISAFKIVGIFILLEEELPNLNSRIL